MTWASKWWWKVREIPGYFMDPRFVKYYDLARKIQDNQKKPSVFWLQFWNIIFFFGAFTKWWDHQSIFQKGDV